MDQKELLPDLFRTEYSKIASVLCKLFGISHIETAEDITSETFLVASETWSLKGLPDNPTAWLYKVATNKAKDYLRRDKLFNEKITREVSYLQDEAPEVEVDLSDKNISDSQLQMMFAICHPLIPVNAQIGLALRILCGFGIDEIADAFLTNKEAINKRLFRARETLRLNGVKIEFPGEAEINKRLETVVTTLYLLFNEGYYSSSQSTVRKDLCLEAMRLVHFLIENKSTDKPFVNALMSLMCFHSSRFEARTNKNGDIILYDDQDTTMWNSELIDKGTFYLNRASEGNDISKYHLEAGIAYWHTERVDTAEKWESILQLYNRLLQIEYSPVAALNRTYALSKANGKAEAIIEAEKLKVSDQYLYYSLLGELYRDVDNSKALTCLQTALKHCRSAAEKTLVDNKVLDLNSKKS